MKKLSFALFIVFLFVTGCNSGSETKVTDVSTEQAAPAAQEAVPPVQTENPAHGEPGHVHTESAPADASSGTGTLHGGEAKLNPPHGEPGHRCDIAAGAPLPY